MNRLQQDMLIELIIYKPELNLLFNNNQHIISYTNNVFQASTFPEVVELAYKKYKEEQNV